MHFGDTIMNKYNNYYFFRIMCFHTSYIEFKCSSIFNKAESPYVKLKIQWGTSSGDFEGSWVKIHTMLELHHIEIKTSFEMSLTSVQYNMKSHLFSELRDSISKVALSILVDEIKDLKMLE